MDHAATLRAEAEHVRGLARTLRQHRAGLAWAGPARAAADHRLDERLATLHRLAGELESLAAIVEVGL